MAESVGLALTTTPKEGGGNGAGALEVLLDESDHFLTVARLGRDDDLFVLGHGFRHDVVAVAAKRSAQTVIELRCVRDG